MNTNEMNTKMKKDEKLSTLWIVVMMNMIFNDICSFMLPEFFKDLLSGNTPIVITQGIMLVFAILLEIPIIMIFLSRVLKGKANRWVNLFASLVTILFVIGGGSLTLHYIFFATVEVLMMLWIIRIAWKI